MQSIQSYQMTIHKSLLDSADGCEAIENEPLNSNFPSITLSWPESNIGVTHSFPCPCLDNPGGGVSKPNVTRTCRGNFISKASWQPVDYNQCGFTDITFKLCETQLVGTLCTKQGKHIISHAKTCIFQLLYAPSWARS